MQLNCFQTGAVKQSGQIVGQCSRCCIGRTPASTPNTLAIIGFTTSCVEFAPCVRLYADTRVSIRCSGSNMQPVPGCLPSHDAVKVPASQRSHSSSAIDSACSQLSAVPSDSAMGNNASAWRPPNLGAAFAGRQQWKHASPKMSAHLQRGHQPWWQHALHQEDHSGPMQGLSHVACQQRCCSSLCFQQGSLEDSM